MRTIAESLPKSIGKYQIRKLIGEGAMGVVYEGFDPGIERRVAIKVLHAHLIENIDGEEFLERFKREARSAAKCTHQNVVIIHEYGQDGGIPFIAMEFVEGMSLHDILKNGRKISLNHALLIISQLLSALNSAHQLGIIHRDIKAANIMILKGGSIKLADFGIALLSDNSKLTMTGAVVGTPKYMAPEQMFGLKTDERSDLFSVAMVFLELLAALPDNSDVPRSSLPEIAGLPPNNRINYAVTYPNALIPVIAKGLARDPDDRFNSAREFVKALKNAIPDLKTASAPAVNVDATVIANEKTRSVFTNKDELDSMTRILSDYVGPIAKNIINEQTCQNDSLPGLARAVAAEIPHPEERQAFLRQWEKNSGTQVKAVENTAARLITSVNPPESFDDEVLKSIKEDYATYIGPLSSRLVQYYSANATSLEQLVSLLADEIPDFGDSQRFRNRWLHL